MIGPLPLYDAGEMRAADAVAMTCSASPAPC